VGHSHRITEMEGALGVAQLAFLKKNLKLRAQNAAQLLKALSPYQEYLQLPERPKHAEHAFMMFPIVVKSDAIDVKDLTAHLEKWNIETRPIFPLVDQPVYRQLFGDILHHYPVAENLNKNGFFIGCHVELGKNDISYIADVFNDFFKKKRLIEA